MSDYMGRQSEKLLFFPFKNKIIYDDTHSKEAKYLLKFMILLGCS